MKNEGIDKLTDRYPFEDDFLNKIKIKVKQPESLSELEQLQLWEKIVIMNKSNQRKRKKYLFALFTLFGGIAASILAIFLLNLQQDNLNTQTVVHNRIEDVKTPEIQSKNIQLVINDHQIITSAEKEAEITYYDNKEVLLDDKKGDQKKGILNSLAIEEFNQLIVPYGKRSVLNLSDGSKIWVNAGTRVVYPSVFSKEKREIYIEGEIFADIAKKEDCPFIVKTKSMETRVLGTSFNITAYNNDTEHRIVLVSGSIKVKIDKRETILAPKQMLSCTDRAFQVKTLDEVSKYTSWKDGLLQYNNESLAVILENLSRYYGYEIICTPDVNFLKCSGKLDLKDNLEAVLTNISKTAPIRYESDDGKYYITSK